MSPKQKVHRPGGGANPPTLSKSEDGVETLLVIIVAFGLLLVAYMALREALTHKQQPLEQKHIDSLREASFAVVEASLQAEPEKWKPVFSRYDKKKVIWLTNREDVVAVWMGSGPTGLFVVQKFGTYNEVKSEALEPPQRMKTAIYTAAMNIVNNTMEKIEEGKLIRLVDAFRDQVKEDKQ